jgi:hypothetical protein
MRAPSEEADAGGSYAAPVGGVTSGGSSSCRARLASASAAMPPLKELYRAKFAGPVPAMRVRGGVVTVAYPRFGWFDWRAQVAGQHIDASAHWRKDTARSPSTAPFRGRSSCAAASPRGADLRSLRLESFELRGGASKIELLLPRPEGVVPIRVAGGMSRISIERPRAWPPD